MKTQKTNMSGSNSCKMSFIAGIMVLISFIICLPFGVNAQESLTTAIGGMAFASSSWDNAGGHPASMAFDGNIYTHWTSWHAWGPGWTMGSLPQHIGYEFSSPVIIVQYNVFCRDATGSDGWRTWQFQAWDEQDQRWVTLHSIADYTSWRSSSYRTFRVSHSTPYQKYRWYITKSSHPRNEFVSAYEVQILGTLAVNHSPSLLPVEDKSVREGELLQFTIQATDPDGDRLTYAASNLPSGAAFDPETQVFSWIPGYGQSGSYPDVLFTATDSGTPPESSSETILITVNPRVPLTPDEPESSLMTFEFKGHIEEKDGWNAGIAPGTEFSFRLSYDTTAAPYWHNLTDSSDMARWIFGTETRMLTAFTLDSIVSDYQGPGTPEHEYANEGAFIQLHQYDTSNGSADEVSFGYDLSGAAMESFNVHIDDVTGELLTSVLTLPSDLLLEDWYNLPVRMHAMDSGNSLHFNAYGVLDTVTRINTPVPEPGTLLLLSIGVIGIAGWLKLRRAGRGENEVQSSQNPMPYIFKGLLIIVLAIVTGCAPAAQTAFHKAEQQNTIEAYQVYLNEYPEGEYATEASNKIETLRFETAKRLNTIEGYQEYLDIYADGKYASEARNSIETLQFEMATRQQTIEGYQEYLNRYPDGQYARKAQDTIHALKQEQAVFKQCTSQDDMNSCKKYLQTYSRGKYITAVRNHRKKLLYKDSEEISAPDSYRVFKKLGCSNSDRQDLYDVSEILYALGNKAETLIESLQNVESQSDLEKFLVGLGKIELIYNLLDIAMAGAVVGDQYQVTFLSLQEASESMGQFITYVRRAIKEMNLQHVNRAAEAFANYQAALVVAAITLPEIVVDSGMYSGARIDSEDPHYVYLGLTLFDECGEVISTNLNKDNYRIEFDDESFHGEIVEVSSNPALELESRLIWLLGDVSGSMSSTDPNTKRVDAAKRIVDALGPNDVLIISSFGARNSPDYLEIHGYGGGHEKAKLKQLIETHLSRSTGGTPLYAAIGEGIIKLNDMYEALKQQISEPIATSIIVLTDGKNEFSPPQNLGQEMFVIYSLLNEPDFIILAAQSSYIPVYTIGLSSSVDTSMLNRIADATNGLFASTDSARGLETIFNQFSTALQGQILVKVKLNKDAFLLRKSAHKEFGIFIQQGKYLSGSF